jgi:hypothetical protein
MSLSEWADLALIFLLVQVFSWHRRRDVFFYAIRGMALIR